MWAVYPCDCTSREPDDTGYDHAGLDPAVDTVTLHGMAGIHDRYDEESWA